MKFRLFDFSVLLIFVGLFMVDGEAHEIGDEGGYLRCLYVPGGDI